MRSFSFVVALPLALAASVALAADAPAIGGMYSTYTANSDSMVHDRAFDAAPADNLDQVVKQLTRAIDRLARYHVPKEPPRIYRIPHAELENYVCGTHCAIRAWYKPGDGIFLDESLKPETNLFHRSILLHEMVHYFQDMSGEYANMGACDRWFHRELDAYTVQNRYLGVIGHPSRVAYSGDNCNNMQQAKDKDTAARTQAFDGIKGRVNPDQH
jgi:hypothetical protein